MSEPFKVTAKFAHNAACEIISGMSALNMEPQPLNLSEEELAATNGYLSDTDYWVNHSMVHFRAAIDNLNLAASQKNKLHLAIFKLMLEIDKDVPLELREKYSNHFDALIDLLTNI